MTETDQKQTLENTEKRVIPQIGEKLKKPGGNPFTTGLIIIIAIGLFAVLIYPGDGFKRGIWLLSRGKDDLKVVSVTPPMGIPIDTKQVKNVVIRFNKPIDNDSLEEGFVSYYPGITSINTTLSEDKMELTVPLPGPDSYLAPQWFVLNKKVKSIFDNRMQNTFSYTFRNKHAFQRKVTEHEVALSGKKFPGTFLHDLRMGYQDSYETYPLFLGSKSNTFTYFPLPLSFLYDSHGKKLKVDDLTKKTTVFIIAPGDGSIESPNSLDVALRVRKYYSPEKLRIVLCYISSDLEMLKNFREKAGKDIILVSDLKGTMGPVYGLIVQSRGMLPLNFFINNEGIVKSVQTGLINVPGFIRETETAGLKPDLLTNPDESKTRALLSRIKNDENPGEAYSELAALYEKSGNEYMALMNRYQSMRYLKADDRKKEEVYYKLLSMGMNRQAFDLYADGSPDNPKDLNNFIMAANAARRFGRPSIWMKTEVFRRYVFFINSMDKHKGSFYRALELFADFKESRLPQTGQFLNMNLRPEEDFTKEKEEELVKALEEALREYKDNPEPDRMAAEYYEDRGDYEKAFEEMSKAVKKQGSDSRDRAKLALYSAELKKLQKAKIMAKESLKTTSTAEAHYALGKIYSVEDKKEKGLQEFIKATELNQFNPQYYRAAAEILKSMGEKEKGRRYSSVGKYLEKLKDMGSLTEADTNENWQEYEKDPAAFMKKHNMDNKNQE